MLFSLHPVPSKALPVKWGGSAAPCRLRGNTGANADDCNEKDDLIILNQCLNYLKLHCKFSALPLTQLPKYSGPLAGNRVSQKRARLRSLPRIRHARKFLSFNNSCAHNEAEILVARCQGTTSQSVLPSVHTATLQFSQVITQELAAELVNLRVSNIYDLSSVRPSPLQDPAPKAGKNWYLSNIYSSASSSSSLPSQTTAAN